MGIFVIENDGSRRRVRSAIYRVISSYEVTYFKARRTFDHAERKKPPREVGRIREYNLADVIRGKPTSVYGI